MKRNFPLFIVAYLEPLRLSLRYSTFSLPLLFINLSQFKEKTCSDTVQVQVITFSQPKKQPQILFFPFQKHFRINKYFYSSSEGLQSCLYSVNNFEVDAAVKEPTYILSK